MWQSIAAHRKTQYKSNFSFPFVLFCFSLIPYWLKAKHLQQLCWCLVLLRMKFWPKHVMLYINMHQKVSLFAMSFVLHCLDFDSSSQFSFLALKSYFVLKGVYWSFRRFSEPVLAVIKKTCSLHEGNFYHFVGEFYIHCLYRTCFKYDIDTVFFMSNWSAVGKEFFFLMLQFETSVPV